MKELKIINPKIGLFLGIILLIFIGMYFRGTEATVTEKDFDPEKYYKGNNSDEVPDYKRIYNEQYAVISNGEKCAREDVPISAGYSIYKPEDDSSFSWFWAINEKDEDKVDELRKSGKDIGEGRTLFEVRKGTELIAIADSTLVPKTQYPISMYPGTDFTKGVHISYDIKLIEKEIAFRVTYSSMEKWWLCADKIEPDSLVDDDPMKPKYIVGETIGSKEFYSSTVLGYSGLTGVPNSHIEAGKSYVIVKIEKAKMDEDGQIISAWEESSIDELYSM